MKKENHICLQNILHPGNAFSQEEQVYFHKSDDGRLCDLDGYFNLFYIEKHQKYSDVDRLFIKLNLSGFVSVTLMHDRDEIQTYPISDAKHETENIFEFPYNEYNNGVFWVRLDKDSCVNGVNTPNGQQNSEYTFSGAYYGEITCKRPAKVLVDICTYKREKT